MFKKDAIKNPDEFFQDRFADYRMKKDGSSEPRVPGQTKGPPGPNGKPVMGKPKLQVDVKSSAIQMFSREKAGPIDKPLAGCEEPKFVPERTEQEEKEIAERKAILAEKRAQMRRVAAGLGK
tara:strand:+ start:832 stop:1197 length:366 start_codon:yes stop_codon:yes gene_type:complete